MCSVEVHCLHTSQIAAPANQPHWCLSTMAVEENLHPVTGSMTSSTSTALAKHQQAQADLVNTLATCYKNSSDMSQRQLHTRLFSIGHARATGTCFCLAAAVAADTINIHISSASLCTSFLTWLFMPTARCAGPKLHSAGSQSTATAVLLRVAVSITVTSPMLVRLATLVPCAEKTVGSAAR